MGLLLFQLDLLGLRQVGLRKHLRSGLVLEEAESEAD